MTKRPLYGMDTKRSARAVKERVLEQVRREERGRKMKKWPVVIGTGLAAVMLVFLFVLLNEQSLPGTKLTTTHPKDSLVVEVHQLTEDNKQDFELEHDGTLEKGVHYKLIKIEYYMEKARGEQVIIDHAVSIAKMYRNLAGLKLEREGSIVYQETSNTEDSFVELQYTILVKSDGLTEEVIRTELNHAKIEVELTKQDGDKTVDTFTLGQYAEFYGEDELSEVLALPSKAVVGSADFLYQLEVKEVQIQAGEPFEVYATLTYTGDQEAVLITHAASPFYYDILETTRGFTIDYFMEQPLLSTELKKGEPLTHQYQVSGGYSEQDSAEYKAFMDQFLAGETPKGKYSVKGFARFKVEGATEDTEISAEIEFEAK